MAHSSDTDYPRRFVPVDADMGDWTHIEPLFDQLDAQPIDSVEAIEAWLLDISELDACVHEALTERYVAMTCHTDDKEKEQAYLDFIGQVEPKCKPRWHRLNERFVASEACRSLPVDRYEVYGRMTTNAVELFREENVALQTEDNKLDTKYKKLCGAMMIEYDGQEQTLQQMARYQQEVDREVRQETWALVADRRLADREAMDDLFDEMVKLRTRIAVNADFASYRDYMFKARERFDYTPGDCIAFHDAIEKVVVPANRAIQRLRAGQLGVDSLRPWDLAVDPLGRSPLRPFVEVKQLCDGCAAIFHRVDPELGAQFDRMVTADWLDLDSRKGKAPGGYQATFDESRHPFIFSNAVGLQRDVETLLHEGGHAFHCLACRDEPLISYRHTGMEMAEVASMGMELLSYEHLDEFYTGDNLTRARREQLEGVISVFPWIATIDAFQHWLYTNPGHSRNERSAYWLSLLDRFGGIEDYSGHEPVREAMWQRQLHLFSVPFYYVEYGIAQIGALQLWQNARRDKAAALRQYRAALALGGAKPLPELWSVGGLNFDFTEATLGPLIDAVLVELDTLE